MNAIHLMGIYVPHPNHLATEIQKVLTTHGCTIRTRLGLNNENKDGAYGLIILETSGKAQEIEDLRNALLKIKDVKVQEMQF